MAEPGLQIFYREVHVDDAGLALGRLYTTLVRGRCPACAHAKVTRGVFGVASRCPVCGSRFDRMAGNALISMPLTYVLTLCLVLLLGLLLIPRYGFFGGVAPLLGLAGGALVLLLLRPMRILTLWLLWLFGFVYPDRVVTKGRPLLPAREEDDPVTYELAASR